jgi:putative flavoprotein involved in K+ transport
LGVSGPGASATHRYALRVSGHEQVVVAGAGAAGLAVAGALKRRGIEAVLLEREPDVALPWERRYESLRLNTPRGLSYLPGYRIPRRYGRWPGRLDMVEYLREYRRRLGLQVQFGIEVRRVHRDNGGWRVDTSQGDVRARCVVLATGHDANPVIPSWPGRDTFKGELLHSAAYREPSPFRERHVLVVSAANSGSEIAFELSRAQAASVRVAMRTPPPIAPREYMGIPLMYSALPIDPLPDRVGDLATKTLQRLIYGNLSARGLPPSPYGVQTQSRRRHRSVLIDAGFVGAVRAGEIEILPAVEELDGAEVVLADGTRVSTDVVIAATGFQTNLAELVGHLGVLDDRGYPVAARGAEARGAPGLFFNGYWASMIGQLLHMRRAAKTIARRIARRTPVPAPSEPPSLP